MLQAKRFTAASVMMQVQRMSAFVARCSKPSGCPLIFFHCASPAVVRFYFCNDALALDPFQVTPAEQKALDALEKTRSKEAARICGKKVKDASKAAEKMAPILSSAKAFGQKPEFESLPVVLKQTFLDGQSWLEGQAEICQQIISSSGSAGNDLADIKDCTIVAACRLSLQQETALHFESSSACCQRGNRCAFRQYICSCSA